MNDRKFLELLNLYIDGEIKPPDAVALELEIKTNPARRTVYNQYCRLHRATQLVCGRFREASVEDAGGQIRALQEAVRHPAEATPASVIDFGRTTTIGRLRRARIWAVAGLAACAVLTVSVVLRQSGAGIAGDGPKPQGQTIASASEPASGVNANAPVRRISSFAVVPFAPEVRRDPYVIEFSPPGLVRLASPASGSDGFAVEPFRSADGFTSLRFTSGPGTSIDFLSPAFESGEQGGSRVFRARSSSNAEGLQPVNFQLQR